MDGRKSTQSQAPETRLCKGVRGHPPPGNFEKLDCLGLHFVHSEGSMLQNLASKSECKSIIKKITACLRVVRGN